MPHTPDLTARLTVTDLRKSFGRHEVLAGIDLEVEASTIVLLAGSNGSGKTTLLRCIAGLARYDGDLALDGELLGRRRAGHPAIGYLPQTLGMPSWATPAELLQLFARLRGRDVELPSLPDGFLPPLDQPVGELSGGQRQRVAFATALLGSPRLLLLDEPAANLDDDGRGEMVTVLQELREQGTSVLVAAPSPGDLNGVPDRMVRLVDGRVEASVGPTASTSGEPPTALRVVDEFRASMLEQPNGASADRGIGTSAGTPGSRAASSGGGPAHDRGMDQEVSA